MIISFHRDTSGFLQKNHIKRMNSFPFLGYLVSKISKKRSFTRGFSCLVPFVTFRRTYRRLRFFYGDYVHSTCPNFLGVLDLYL